MTTHTIEHMPAWLAEQRGYWAKLATECYDAGARANSGALSRIREAYDECGDTYDAYAYAITMEFQS